MAETPRPPALKHGLTSRTARTEQSDQVRQLAGALGANSPNEPEIVEAAWDVAEATLHLRRIQQCRLQVLEGGTLRRNSPTEREKELADELSRAVKSGDVARCRELLGALRAAHDREWVVGVEAAATFILGDEVGERGRELRRLADYERRAHSMRRKAIRRLDYARVEAERRHIRSLGRRASHGNGTSRITE